METMEPVVLVHGGAGEVKDQELAKKLVHGVKLAAIAGYRTLKKSGNVLDAVESAVRYLEDDENYNAGKGSVLNVEGEVEMDASIMLGSNLECGAVTVVKDVKNAITLARLVMEKTPHVLLAGAGANKFAAEQNVEILPAGSLVTKRRADDLKRILRERSEAKHELGTVGAVAICPEGKLAAATSTGGYEGKMVGRSSDTCIIGSGTYADDNHGAVSTTGHGESIAKFCLAHTIIKELEGGSEVQDATQSSCDKMTARLKNTAGAITISKNGNVGIGFSSPRMSWAYVKKNELHFGIDKDQHEIEKISIEDN